MNQTVGIFIIFIATIQLITSSIVQVEVKKPQNSKIVYAIRPHSKQMNRRHSQDVFRRLRTLDFSESNQFCGETLFYAVEYYCIFIKGTSVYTPDYNFESTYVIGEDYDLDKENENRNRNRRNVKKIHEKGLHYI